MSAGTGLSVTDQCGLIPRIAQRLLTQQALSDDHSVLCCSFCEVYNEQVYDLLAPRPGLKNQRLRLSICEGADGTTHVRNLQHESFNRLDTLMQILSFGTRQRSVRQTALNQQSSRGVLECFRKQTLQQFISI